MYMMSKCHEVNAMCQATEASRLQWHESRRAFFLQFADLPNEGHFGQKSSKNSDKSFTSKEFHSNYLT